MIHYQVLHPLVPVPFLNISAKPFLASVPPLTAVVFKALLIQQKQLKKREKLCTGFSQRHESLGKSLFIQKKIIITWKVSAAVRKALQCFGAESPHRAAQGERVR